MPPFLTTRQVGEIVERPEWLIRRVVDSLGVPIAKFGHKRMIPADLVDAIRQAIAARESRHQATGISA